jgi:hypothetical protein
MTTAAWNWAASARAAFTGLIDAWKMQRVLRV